MKKTYIRNDASKKGRLKYDPKEKNNETERGFFEALFHLQKR